MIEYLPTTVYSLEQDQRPTGVSMAGDLDLV